MSDWIRDRFSEFCPFMNQLLSQDKEFWERVYYKYIKKLNYLKSELRQNKSVETKKTFIDYLLEYRLGNHESIHLLKEIDNRANNVYNNLPFNLQNKFKTVLRELIENFDNKQSKSFDRIAEIFSLHFIMDLKELEIIDLEYPLPNKKSIDCLLFDKKLNKEILIDFYSIHTRVEKIESSELFIKFLIKRITDKFKVKTENIGENDLINKIRILPIIWSDLDILIKYKDIFVESNTIINEEFFTLYGIRNSETNECFSIFKPVRLL